MWLLRSRADLKAQGQYLSNSIWLGVHEAMLARQAWGHIIDAMNALEDLESKMCDRKEEE